MRLAVLSDIHGNLPALKAVIADLGAFGVDAVVNLGDCASVPYGRRRPSACCESSIGRPSGAIMTV